LARRTRRARPSSRASPPGHEGHEGRERKGVGAVAVIEVTRLTKHFGRTVALDGLSFSVDAGQVCGFLGPNGAGKTTTLPSLLGDPQVLLLDEPANGLDPEGMRWLRGFLRDQATAGHTVIISSHVLAEVAQTVDEVVIINRGRFVDQSSIAELRARAGGSVRARSTDAAGLRAALRDAGMPAKRTRSGEVEVTGATTEEVGRLAAANGIVLLELASEGGSLEEIFVSLTTGSAANDGTGGQP